MNSPRRRVGDDAPSHCALLTHNSLSLQPALRPQVSWYAADSNCSDTPITTFGHLANDACVSIYSLGGVVIYTPPDFPTLFPPAPGGGSNVASGAAAPAAAAGAALLLALAASAALVR